MSDQSATPSAARGRRWFLAVLAVMVVLAVAAGVALARMRDTVPGDARGPGPGASAPAGSPASAPVGPPASAPSSDSLAPGGSAEPPRPPEQSPAPGSGAPGTSTTRTVVNSLPASSKPVIVHFRVASEPSCPSGTDQVRSEGAPVVLEWKVTGADRTTLAVDGPGLYAEYGAAGTTKVNFPCGGEPGSYQSHTYTLTAFGDTATRTRTLTVKARVQGITAT